MRYFILILALASFGLASEQAKGKLECVIVGKKFVNTLILDQPLKCTVSVQVNDARLIGSKAEMVRVQLVLTSKATTYEEGFIRYSFDGKTFKAFDVGYAGRTGFSDATVPSSFKIKLAKVTGEFQYCKGTYCRTFNFSQILKIQSLPARI